jgi:putative aminopeptidase FrvX
MTRAAHGLTNRASETLLDLMRVPGLAGHEQPVARFMRERMRPFADEVREDRFGNVIATLHGVRTPRRRW